jgi:hypothetical protein
MEFVGSHPRNSSVVSRIRDHGYVSVMFNKDDFMDAVVWAANIVYEYGAFFGSHSLDRIVIPQDELPIIKSDAENAHFIMLIYYNMKKNFVLLEQIKQSLYTLARYQRMDEKDAELMKKVDEKMARAAREDDDGFNFNAEPDLRGAEKRYKYYASLVTAQIEKYRTECAKAQV